MANVDNKIEALIRSWRGKATDAEEHGDNNTSGAYDECADELEAVVKTDAALASAVAKLKTQSG